MKRSARSLRRTLWRALIFFALLAASYLTWWALALLLVPLTRGEGWPFLMRA